MSVCIPLLLVLLFHHFVGFQLVLQQFPTATSHADPSIPANAAPFVASWTTRSLQRSARLASRLEAYPRANIEHARPRSPIYSNAGNPRLSSIAPRATFSNTSPGILLSTTTKQPPFKVPNRASGTVRSRHFPAVPTHLQLFGLLAHIDKVATDAKSCLLCTIANHLSSLVSGNSGNCKLKTR